MHVVVQLCCGESAGVKGHWMNFIFLINNGKNYSESIVQSISFYDELSVRNSMSEDGSGFEHFLERIESITIGEVKIPRDVLLGEVYQ